MAWYAPCHYLNQYAGISTVMQFVSYHVHDDVNKRKHLPRYWPFVRGIPRSPVNSPHKGQWRGALMFSLICVWINDWVNNREVGDLRRYRAHYDVIVLWQCCSCWWSHAYLATSHLQPSWWRQPSLLFGICQGCCNLITECQSFYIMPGAH